MGGGASRSSLLTASPICSVAEADRLNVLVAPGGHTGCAHDGEFRLSDQRHPHKKNSSNGGGEGSNPSTRVPFFTAVLLAS